MRNKRKKQQKKKKRRKQFKGSHFSKKHDDFNKARRPRLSVGWIMKLPNWKSSFTICSAVKCHDKHTGEKQHREWKWRNVNLHLHGVVKLFYFFFLVCLFFSPTKYFYIQKKAASAPDQSRLMIARYLSLCAVACYLSQWLITILNAWFAKVPLIFGELACFINRFLWSLWIALLTII